MPRQSTARPTRARCANSIPTRAQSSGRPARPNILGSPSINGAGVIAASTFELSSGASNATYLIDADTGAILNTLPRSAAFPQPVFVGGDLLAATQTNGVQVYAPQCGADAP